MEIKLKGTDRAIAALLHKEKYFMKAKGIEVVKAAPKPKAAPKKVREVKKEKTTEK